MPCFPFRAPFSGLIFSAPPAKILHHHEPLGEKVVRCQILIFSLK